MSKLIIWVFALCFAAISTIAHAGSSQLLCEMSNKGTHGWIAPEIFIIYADGTDNISVYDGFIDRQSKGRPLQAKVLSKRSNLVTFNWRLSLRASSGEQLRVRYTAELNETTNAIKVRSKLLNTQQSEFANGRCAPVK